MADEVAGFLDEWHRIVAEKDLGALERVLAEDVSLGAPPYWRRLEGREIVHHLLGLIVNTIEGFTYHREWSEGRELALEFRGHVGADQVQGIYLITLGEDGRVANLDVMIRPLDSLVSLRDKVAPRMTSYLAAGR